MTVNEAKPNEIVIGDLTTHSEFFLRRVLEKTSCLIWGLEGSLDVANSFSDIPQEHEFS